MRDEVGDQLPVGWVWSTLGEVAADRRAITDGPFGSNLKTAHYTERGPRVVRLENLGDGHFVDKKTHISRQHFEKLRKHEVLPGDLVIASLGSPLPRACQTPIELGPAIVKADCIRFRGDESIVSPGYVCAWLNSPALRDRAKHLIHGMGRPRLSLAIMRDLPVPVAPRAEQDRIVAKLDELFSRIEKGEENLRRVQALVKRYRQSVLKAAVTGELTRGWREQHSGQGETGADLLQRILTARRAAWEAAELEKIRAKGKVPGNDKWKTKYKEPLNPSIKDLPELPEGWIWASLDQLCWDSSYGTSNKCSFEGAGEPVLRIPNVREGRLDQSGIKKALKLLGLQSHEYVKSGDLLVIRTNGSPAILGLGTVVAENPKVETYFASYLIRFRLVALAKIREWIGLYWHSKFVRDLIRQESGTSAGQHNISQSVLLGFPIALPPATEAEVALDLFEHLSAPVSEMEATALDLERSCTMLRQSVLRVALEGRLVSQDMSDESALALLSRVAEVRKEHHVSKPRLGRRRSSDRKDDREALP